MTHPPGRARADADDSPTVPPARPPSDQRDLLRFITCGSVDDGKSTLLGRLLHEAGAVPDDQRAAPGAAGNEPDYSLLLDGLAAEREQGITIDVAYRYFTTGSRTFIAADAPGHEQYTRNMVTGASTADLAILLIDARKGVLVQTRRHAFLAALLGVPHVLVAVNKMDLVDYAEATFRAIERDCRALAAAIGLGGVACVPVSALRGDNLIAAGGRMPWYDGPSLLHLLETVPVDATRLQRAPFRMAVQWVNRAADGFRGLAGTVASGTLRPGQRIVVQPSGRETTVARIVTGDGDLALAVANQSVTLVLEDQLDVSRGDLLADAAAPAQVADRFEATVVWMGEAPLLRGRDYLLKCGARMVTATVAPIKYRIDVNSHEHVAATHLAQNEIGVVNLQLDRNIAFDPYAENRDTGGFILIDRATRDTVGAGMLGFALRRSQNVRWQAIEVDKQAHASIKQQRPCVLWFTGLSGAGKSTIANLVEKKLFAERRHTCLLDGDNLRHGLCKDLGFTAADRVENIRRVAEVAHLMVDAGLIVLTAFISPFRNERHTARALLAPGEFIEIFVDTPLADAELRDPKGLYRKARRGELANFTGIDSPYEAPEQPELRIDTSVTSAEEAAERIVALLRERGMLG